MKPIKSQTTGDKRKCTLQLDASKATLKAEKSQLTGDKGNPHYAEELEQPIKAQMTSGTRSTSDTESKRQER